MKNLRCDKCGKILIILAPESKFKPNIIVRCTECDRPPKYDLPPGFENLFGKFGK